MAAGAALGGGPISGNTEEEMQNMRDARDAIANREGINVAGSAFKEGTRAIATSLIAKGAGMAFGTELDADTYFARTGGKVLNPNAEMLFQGPSIRDFAFSFIMIARSKQEGREIRKQKGLNNNH